MTIPRWIAPFGIFASNLKTRWRFPRLSKSDRSGPFYTNGPQGTFMPSSGAACGVPRAAIYALCSISRGNDLVCGTFLPFAARARFVLRPRRSSTTNVRYEYAEAESPTAMLTDPEIYTTQLPLALCFAA